MFNLKTLTVGAASLAIMASAAAAETVIRLQSVLPTSGDEVRMVEDFANDVEQLTNGSVRIEILPAGAVMSTESLAPVDTVPTPNPNAIMLKVQETLVPSGTHEFTSGDDTASSPLATALLALEGIELVLIAPRFVTLRKNSEVDWPDLVPDAKDAMRAFLASGEMAVLEEVTTIDPAKLGEIEQKILRLLDEEIRPALAMDGGDINYLGFENGIVQVAMVGACGTCPSATATLKMGVERLLQEEIPEVMSVEQI